MGRRLARALELRRRMFVDPSVTNGYRLVNGEGDGLPGLVIDIYAGTLHNMLTLEYKCALCLWQLSLIISFVCMSP